jgi:subtilisin family serine protease
MLFKYIVFLIVILVTILSAKENPRYWIYLRDKYIDSSGELPTYSNQSVNERALLRRQLRGSGPVYDFADLPLSQKYITELEKLGLEIYRESRWLNAVSCYLKDIQIEEVMNLSFVVRVEQVRTNIYRPVEVSDQHIFDKPVSEDYGPSFNQNDMIGVPYAHEMGFHGEDILIAVFDTGFILDHEALRHIEVIDAWDFIYDDDNVADEDEDVSGQHNHGTQVLSVLAGYSPGNLIGPAYAAQFLLAKTDHLTLENQQDEDNWVAAVEWAENLGADVISSSVGYAYELGYTYEDLDGNTAASTIAADMAVKKGVSVFNSAGNVEKNIWEHIIVPADGDSVIAIGAVTPDGDYVAFSSPGPTYDGRIKPDLAAQGQYTYCVNPRSTDRYTTADGTSVACPLGSGAGAIVLSIMPTMTPVELRDLLVKHASQANNPDNFRGYGIIDLEKTIFDLIGEPVVSVSNFDAIPRDGNNLIQWIVDLEIANEKWLISRRTPTTQFVEIGELAGREFGISEETYSFFDFQVEGGESFIYKVSAQYLSGTISEIDTTHLQSNEPSTVSLSPNFPNPFNSETKIIFGLNTPQQVSLKIYDITGQLVKTLIDNQELDAQFHHILWDGTNNQNHSISSGTYFIRLTANGVQNMMKMFYLK